LLKNPPVPRVLLFTCLSHAKGLIEVSL